MTEPQLCLFVPPPCCKITAIPFYSEICIIVGFLLVSLDYWVKPLVSVVMHSPTPGLLHGEAANEIPLQGSLGKVWEGNSWLWQTVLCVLLKGAKRYRRARILRENKNHKLDLLLNEDEKRSFAFGCCNIPLDTKAKPVVSLLENWQQGFLAVTVVTPGPHAWAAVADQNDRRIVGCAYVSDNTL